MPGKVGLRDIEHVPIHGNLAVLQPERAAAEFLHVIHAVRNQQQGAATRQVVLHPAHAFFLEGFIPYRQHFIRDQKVRLEGGNDGKPEADNHARGVVFHRLINVGTNIRELDDAWQALRNLASVQSIQRTRHGDIVASAVLGVETGTQFKQRADLSVNVRRAFGRGKHAGNQLEQGRLACPVLADDGDRLASFHFQVDVVQNLLAIDIAPTQQQSAKRTQAIGGTMGFRESLPQPFRANQDLAHRKSSKCGSRRRNNQDPTRYEITAIASTRPNAPQPKFPCPSSRKRYASTKPVNGFRSNQP